MIDRMPSHNAMLSAMILWLTLLPAGCVSAYHETMREYAQSDGDHMIDRIDAAEHTHERLQKHLRASIEKATNLHADPPRIPRRLEHAHQRMLVTLNLADLEAWNTSRNLLAIGDRLQRSAATDLAEAYRDAAEAFAINEELIASLTDKLHAHAALLKHEIEFDPSAELSPIPEELFTDWERVQAHADHVAETLDALRRRTKE